MITLLVDRLVLFVKPKLMHRVVQIKIFTNKYQRAASKNIHQLAALIQFVWGSSVAKQQVGILTFSAKVTPSLG